MTESKTEPKINVTKVTKKGPKIRRLVQSSSLILLIKPKNSIIILPQLEKMELTEKNKLH